MQGKVCGSCGKGCGCVCHKIVPVLITLLGLDFVLGNFGLLSGGFVTTSWPVLLTLIGIIKLTRNKCKCC
jgi:hypothetical protein